MQTKKRVSGRTASRENGTPKVTRGQKKVSEEVEGTKKNVKELITSSARKQTRASILSKKTEEAVKAKITTTKYVSLQEEICNTSCVSDKVKVHSTDDEESVPVSGTIFSPTFHLSKSTGGEITTGDSCKMGDAEMSFNGRQSDEQLVGQESNQVISHCNLDSGANLSSEVSAIYHAMKNSELECVDEHGQDSMTTTDICMVDDEDCEEYDEFDPYFFIKNLPELSSVVPTFRPLLLPKQTRSCPSTTLVLDLDETLVHSSLTPCDSDFTFPVHFNNEKHTVYVRCRPHLQEFIERVASLFEIAIFTASQSIYAEQLLNVLDPKRKFFRHRIYRESCVFVDGNYLKDLSVLGRDLARVIIVDNSPQAFGFQVDNGIPIESWFEDTLDKELLLLLPFLESLVGVQDVRPLIANKFNLRQKVASACILP